MSRGAGTAAAVAAALALALALAGCGASGATGSHRLVLIPDAGGGGALGCGARAEARRLGVSLTVDGPARRSAPAQILIVNSVIAAKPAAVLIAPADRRALIAPIQSMRSSGITVVRLDTTHDEPRRALRAEGVAGVERAVNAIDRARLARPRRAPGKRGC